MKSGSIASNTVSLVGGRIFLSASRLAALLIISRLAGAEAFGGYALILSFIALMDWLVDFGQTDITVREAASEDESGRWLSALARNKLLFSSAAAILLPLIIIAMGYEPALVQAALAGSAAVLLQGLIQLPRAVLKISMRQDIDVLGEVLGIPVLLVGLTWAGMTGAPLWVYLASFAAARSVHLSFLLVRAEVRRHCVAALNSPTDRRLRLASGAAPLGVAGLIALLYESIAPILLSKLYGLEAVSLYAAAVRFVMPVVIVIQALNSAFFPALAARFEDRPLFAETQQNALLIGTLLTTLMVTGLFAGAPFLMSLLGPEFTGGVLVLRVISLVFLARAITTIMTPLVVIARKQKIALALSTVSIVVQLGLQFLLVPKYGALGAAISYLLTEPLLGAVAVALLGQHVASVSLDWWMVMRVYVLCLVIVAAVYVFVPPALSIAAMFAAPTLLLLTFILIGTISLPHIKELALSLKLSPTGNQP